jgi:hypothetical protein
VEPSCPACFKCLFSPHPSQFYFSFCSLLARQTLSVPCDPLIYCGALAAVGSCPKWLGNPTSNDSDHLPKPSGKTRTILDDCTISHRRMARPSQLRAGNVRFDDRCCVTKGAVPVSRSSGRRR